MVKGGVVGSYCDFYRCLLCNSATLLQRKQHPEVLGRRLGSFRERLSGLNYLSEVDTVADIGAPSSTYGHADSAVYAKSNKATTADYIISSSDNESEEERDGNGVKEV
jgi:hypothetical protein